MKNIFYILLLFNLVYCTKKMEAEPEVAKTKNSSSTKDSIKTHPENSKLSKADDLKDLNSKIIHTLKEKNYTEFSRYIHPERGISFALYSHLNPKTDKHFSLETFDRFVETPTKFTWGEQDGTGDLLVLSIKDYLHQWLFKRDYTESEYFYNKFKGAGNTPNNIKEFFPNAEFTENYIEGSEIYGGLDWDSLIFVFEEYEGKYYLVAAVNNSWTT